MNAAPPGAVIVHADWGKNPRKRWIARARRGEKGWAIEALAPWVGGGSPLQSLGLSDDLPGPILIGADFPIGLPVAYARAADITSFREALPLLDEEFYAVAEKPDQISVRRPFYPYRPGGTSHAHLEAAHKATYMDLLRRCEQPTADHGAACCLFWTLGGKQVGKAAITGWRELVIPLLLGADAGLWPFDGDLAVLMRSHRVTIAETYPAEHYVAFGFGKQGSWRKSRQSDRIPRSTQLRAAAVAVASVSPGVEEAIASGFGAESDGEDRFDALVGLIGMLHSLRDSAEAPTDPVVRGIEGWILGQPWD